VKDGAPFRFLLEKGAYLRKGRTISLWESFLRGGVYYKGKARARQVQRQAKAKAKKRIRIKTKKAKRRKDHQGKGCLTSQGLWGSLRGNPRHPRVVSIVPSSLVYVSCVVHFTLRPSISICSKLDFPMGRFFQGHVDQKSMCQFHACLEVQINILKLKI
jgi:hypothetical protein